MCPNLCRQLMYGKSIYQSHATKFFPRERNQLIWPHLPKFALRLLIMMLCGWSNQWINIYAFLLLLIFVSFKNKSMFDFLKKSLKLANLSRTYVRLVYIGELSSAFRFLNCNGFFITLRSIYHHKLLISVSIYY